MPNRKIKHIIAKLVGASTEETLDVYDVDAVHTDKIYNALDQTAAGYVLDARQGKALNDSIGNKQNSFITSTITGTTDQYGFIDTGIWISATQIFCPTVTNTAGYGAIPIKRGNYWQFFIFAVGAAISGTNTRYVISVGESLFTVSFLRTK